MTKGILFKPDMIKAITEGRKTQTRRVAGLKEINKEPNHYRVFGRVNEGYIFGYEPSQYTTITNRYQVGGIVYIKEVHRFVECDGNLNDFGVEYKDGDCRLWRDNNEEMNYPINGRWRSPMFMPERFARYFIKITGVRVERLQSITEADAEAEGIIPSHELTNREQYAELWDSINKTQKWSTNPWLWVYSFVQVEKPE